VELTSTNLPFYTVPRSPIPPEKSSSSIAILFYVVTGIDDDNDREDNAILVDTGFRDTD